MLVLSDAQLRTAGSLSRTSFAALSEFQGRERGLARTARMRDIEAAFRSFRDHGDADAFAEVWDQSADRLHQIARRIAPDPGDAEEAIQRTFLAALEGAQSFQDGRALMPWLLAILRRQLAQVARERHRALRRVARDGRVPLDPSELAAKREFDQELTRAIERLPEHLRPVLRLRLWHGLAPRAIAETLERSPSTVRTQLARGLAQLRALLPKCLAAVALFGREAPSMAAARACVLRAAASCTSPALCVGGTIQSFAIALGAIAVLALAGLQLFAGKAELPQDQLGREHAREVEGTARQAAHEEDMRVDRREARTERSTAPGHAEPVAALRLRIVDAQGKRMPGIRVDFAPKSAFDAILEDFLIQSPQVNTRSKSQRSDAHGEITVSLTAGPWLLTINPGRASQRSYGESRTSITMGGAELEREVVLERAGSRVRVRVVDERGQVVAGVPLSLVRESRLEVGGGKKRLFCWKSDSPPAAQCNACHAAPEQKKAAPKKKLRIARKATSDAGIAEFQELRAGRYRVLLGPALDQLALLPGSLESVAIAQESELHWRPARAAAMVEVDGYKLAHVEYRVARKGSLNLELGQHDCEVAILARPAKLTPKDRRRLAQSCGFEAPSFEELRTAAPRRKHGFGAECTEAALAPLAPGAYELRFEVPATSTILPPAPMRVLVEAGGRAEARVAFQRAAASLSGQVFCDGRVAAGCVLELVREGERHVIKRTRCDAAGKYVFRGLTPGKYHILWVHRRADAAPSTREQRGKFRVEAPGGAKVHHLDSKRAPAARRR